MGKLMQRRPTCDTPFERKVNRALEFSARSRSSRIIKKGFAFGGEIYAFNRIRYFDIHAEVLQRRLFLVANKQYKIEVVFEDTVNIAQYLIAHAAGNETAVKPCIVVSLVERDGAGVAIAADHKVELLRRDFN